LGRAQWACEERIDFFLDNQRPQFVAINSDRAARHSGENIVGTKIGRADKKRRPKKASSDRARIIISHSRGGARAKNPALVGGGLKIITRERYLRYSLRGFRRRYWKMYFCSRKLLRLDFLEKK